MGGGRCFVFDGVVFDGIVRSSNIIILPSGLLC
jgi:hypothetical protein